MNINRQRFHLGCSKSEQNTDPYFAYLVTYQFFEALFRDHRFYLADAITERQFRRDNQLGLSRFGLIATLLVLFLLFLLGGVEHFIVRYLQNIALVLLEFVYGRIRNGQDAILGQVRRC